ncbi:alpha/beta hydrolase [Siminovitchia sediminis]|uniref:Alpha/beta hydrolase n=1 Tax=Siminovitchia sediminis TaxID=1274353 RepID=A0ABW4KKP3_9BACI
MSEENIAIERNLVYKDTGFEKLTADVYRPIKGDQLPAVILVHGGAYQSGSKDMYREWGPILAKYGFVTVSINYRLTTAENASWPGVQEDIKSAVDWLVDKANKWGIDPMRLGVIGDSAGAHLGSLLAFETASKASFKIQAFVGIYGIYDLTVKVTERQEMMFRRLIGKSLQEAPEEYKKASPIDHVGKAAAMPTFVAEFLLVWGDADRVASPQQSENFAQRLKEAGISVETIILPGQGHFWFNLTPGLEGGSLADFPNKEIAPRIVRFLRGKLCKPKISDISEAHIQRLTHLQRSEKVGLKR